MSLTFTFSPMHSSSKCFCLFPCLRHPLPFTNGCRPRSWLAVWSTLWLQITSLDDKCSSHLSSWHCLSPCHHLFQVHMCTHLHKAMAAHNSHFLSWSISYTWHRLIRSKRHKSNLNTLRLVWSLVDVKACTRKPLSSLDNNWVKKSQCDEEIKMIIVSLLKLALKASLENAARLVSVLTKGLADSEYGTGSDNWKKAAVIHCTETKLGHC